MTPYREILRLTSQGMSKRGIATSCHCSRNTITAVLERAEQCNISWPLDSDQTDAKLHQLLFPEKCVSSSRKIPDCERIHKEMAKTGVTLTLLWNEYCEECHLSGEIPLMYSQFCRYYRRYASTTKATMRIKRKPGEIMEVDWAGKTASIINNITGQTIPAYVFVAALPCSQFAYVEAFLSMDMESWITAHIHAYQYFGGVTRILVPDNLKTGVDRVSRPTPTINRTYNEMAEHYGTAVIPTRVKHPKDKSTVEGIVGIITTWIIASVRNQQFFSLKELNEAIFIKLDEFNEKPFQKKPGSRKSAFLEEEKALLLPLPASPYELATWKKAIVQYDYLIQVDKNKYSVPYEYIKHEVDIRVTSKIIEVFYHNHRIASHVRIYGEGNDPVILPEHMPNNHKQYLAWNSERFMDWARSVGPNTEVAMQAILSSHKVEPQGYRSCMSLMKLADKYSVNRVESACRKALSYTPSPNLKSIQTILKTGQDKIREGTNPEADSKKNAEKFGFTRGADYFGGKKYD
ncbi:MAG: IS21 family transposase [Syntrophomonadaceae bacterium]|jgi:transposase|nr:IS21 family transposase [Syntrophomonadaceae bacterium]